MTENDESHRGADRVWKLLREIALGRLGEEEEVQWAFQG